MSGLWAVEEDEELLKFVVEQARKSKEPLNLRQLYRDYTASGRTDRTENACYDRFRSRIGPNVYSMDHLDLETKVRIIVAFSVPINEEFLKKLREHAEVKTDENGCIRMYREQGGLEIERKTHRFRCSPFRKEDDERAMQFLAKRAVQTKKCISMCAFWQEYTRISKISASWKSLDRRFRRYLAPIIHLMDEFDTQTKVLMLFCSSTPVEKQFLEKLSERAVVEVDEKRKITKYAGDGLELIQKKKEKARSSIGKRRIFLSESESESESSESRPILRTRKRLKKMVVDEESDEDSSGMSSPNEYSFLDGPPPVKIDKKEKELFKMGAVKTETSSEPPEYMEKFMSSMKEMMSSQASPAPPDYMKDFMSSMKEMFESQLRSQTQVMRQFIGSGPTAASFTNASKKIVLNYFKNLIQELDDPELSMTEQKLNESIGKLSAGDEKLSAEEMKKMKSMLKGLDDILN
ncbi:unnamed protein product [Caenorhabditis sp. 36 PRJEB53466]|nr:unnamed protein product [Caenorhabditis sp. 36 PRJEB53466]